MTMLPPCSSSSVFTMRRLADKRSRLPCAARAAVASLELCVKASAAVKPSLAVDQLAAETLIAGALRAILLCIHANLKGREAEYPDAVAEAKSIEDRARNTGVYSR